MKFRGRALIEVTIEAPSKAIAERKFEDDMQISSYGGIKRRVMLEPELEEISE